MVLALQHLHNNQIIHRDLKPENIMISLERHGHIKLVDFGLSKVVAPGDKTYTICGTHIYLAPEMIAGHGHDHRVDIWQLGVLISELITG